MDWTGGEERTNHRCHYRRYRMFVCMCMCASQHWSVFVSLEILFVLGYFCFCCCWWWTIACAEWTSEKEIAWDRKTFNIVVGSLSSSLPEISLHTHSLAHLDTISIHENFCGQLKMLLLLFFLSDIVLICMSVWEYVCLLACKNASEKFLLLLLNLCVRHERVTYKYSTSIRMREKRSTSSTTNLTI